MNEGLALYLAEKAVLKTCDGNATLIKFIYSEKATKFCEIFP